MRCKKCNEGFEMTVQGARCGCARCEACEEMYPADQLDDRGECHQCRQMCDRCGDIYDGEMVVFEEQHMCITCAAYDVADIIHVALGYDDLEHVNKALELNGKVKKELERMKDND